MSVMFNHELQPESVKFLGSNKRPVDFMPDSHAHNQNIKNGTIISDAELRSIVI